MNIKSITPTPCQLLQLRQGQGRRSIPRADRGREPFGEVKLNIDAGRTKQIVALIADLIAEAGQQTAAAMTADVINGSALLTDGAAA